MPALLILLCVALGALMLRSASGAEARLGRREALLASAVLVALFATAVAELSSLLWRFDRSVVIGAWLFFSVLLAAGIWRARTGCDRSRSRARSPFEAGGRVSLGVGASVRCRGADGGRSSSQRLGLDDV